MVEFCSIDNKIYFFNRPGIAVEIEDKCQFIATVCKLMDGKKNITELKNFLASSFPNETPHLEKLLQTLDDQFLLEDVYYQQNNLSSYDTSRWSRNIEFFNAHCKANGNKYAYQEKLKLTKVAILGLGGVGSNVLYNLAALGVCNITAIDYDTVELSNLNRQIIYKESDIGKFKTLAAKDQIYQFLPNSNINFINRKISSSTDIIEVISGHDLVICAIDHPRDQVMDWINTACIKQYLPFICGSLDSRLAMYYSIIPGKTGCIECWKTNARTSSYIFQELIQEENFTSANSPNVAIMPFMSMLAGLISNEFLKIITQISEPQSLGKLCTFDFFSMQTMISESWKKNPSCLVC